MGLVNGRCILRPVAVNIGALVDVLPHLFLARRLLYPLDDLRRIWANNGAQALSAAFSVPHVGKILPLEHPGVLEHPQALHVCWRQLRRRAALQAGDLRFNLRPGHQIFPPQLRQLAPAQPRPLAELNQLVVVGLGKVPVAHPVTAAPLDILPVPLWGLEVVFIVGRNAVQLAHGLGLQLYRPGGKPLVGPGLQPLVDVLPGAFQRGTFRVMLLDVLDKILGVLPVALVGVERENLLLIRACGHGRPLALPEGLHPHQLVICLLMEVFIVRLIPAPHRYLHSFVSLI